MLSDFMHFVPGEIHVFEKEGLPKTVLADQANGHRLAAFGKRKFAILFVGYQVFGFEFFSMLWTDAGDKPRYSATWLVPLYRIRFPCSGGIRLSGSLPPFW